MSRFAGRPLDQLWFWFLAIHLPITLMVDLQALYPKAWVEGTSIQALVKWYISLSRDPILGGALGSSKAWDWLRTFFVLECTFQAPCFVIGAWGLWNNDKRVYPLLVAYGASTATTLLPVLNAVLTDTETKPALNASELGMLLSSYVPFLVVPLAIAVDMAWRLTKIAGAEQARKRV